MSELLVLIIVAVLLIVLAFVFGYYMGSSKIDSSSEKDLTEALRHYQQVQQYIHQNGII